MRERASSSRGQNEAVQEEKRLLTVVVASSPAATDHEPAAQGDRLQWQLVITVPLPRSVAILRFPLAELAFALGVTQGRWQVWCGQRRTEALLISVLQCQSNS